MTGHRWRRLSTPSSPSKSDGRICLAKDVPSADRRVKSLASVWLYLAGGVSRKDCAGRAWQSEQGEVLFAARFQSGAAPRYARGCRSDAVLPLRDPMTSAHATAVVPHLALTVHLNCYERDIAAGKVA